MGTTPLDINIQGFNVGELTTGIKNAGPARDLVSLATKTSEALDRHDIGLEAILSALQGVAGADAKLPILIRDSLGNVVGTLGYKELNNTAIYGLTVADQRGNLAAFVGVQTEVPLPITATTNANPDVITVPGNTFVNGDTVLNEGALGDTAINIIGIVENVNTGAGTFTMTDLLGAPIAGSGVYGGGGTCQRFYGGGSFQTISIGASGQIRAFADGRVVINGAPITLDANGITTTLGNIAFTGAGVAGIDVKNDTGPSQDVVVTDRGFFIRATDQIFYAVGLSAGSDIGHLALKKLGSSFAATLDAQQGLAISDNSGNSSRLNATQLLLGATIFADASISEIDLGAAGSAQAFLSPSVLRVQNAANTRFVQVSQGGSVNGQDVGGATWLISGGGVSGVDGTGAWLLNGSGLTIGLAQVVGPRLAAISDVTLVTTETAPATYDATAISMLTHLKADVTSLKNSQNAWLNRARISTGHGLIS